MRYPALAMARRPEYPLRNAAARKVTTSDSPMSEEQIRELRRSLFLLSPHIVKERYKTVLDRCRFYDLASPRMMQELVSLWKVLWRWRK
jgi:hypothetical protein